METNDSARFISVHFVLSLLPFSILAIVASIFELELNFFAEFVDYIVNGVLLLGVLLLLAFGFTVLYLMQMSIDPSFRKWKLPVISLFLQLSSIVLIFCYIVDVPGLFS